MEVCQDFRINTHLNSLIDNFSRPYSSEGPLFQTGLNIPSRTSSYLRQVFSRLRILVLLQTALRS